MRIGMDLDGVVADFVGGVAAATGFDLDYESLTTWDAITEQAGFNSTSELFDWLNEHKPTLFADLDPLPGALDALQRINDEGYELVIITSRPQRAWALTRLWLEWHQVEYAELHVVDDKTTVPQCDVYLDDGDHNIKALVDAFRHGSLVVRWVRPWNRPIPGSVYVKDWDSFFVRVETHRRFKAAGHFASPPEVLTEHPKLNVRQFDTGANRDVADHKHDYEGFLSPLVIREFGRYMHSHRKLADGTLRDSDNWQKGIPLDVYMKSAWRHFFDAWMIHRGHRAVDFDGNTVTHEDALLGLLFNVQGYLHEILSSAGVDVGQLSSAVAADEVELTSEG